MTQQLMEANLYLERGAFPLDEQILKELKKKKKQHTNVQEDEEH